MTRHPGPHLRGRTWWHEPGDGPLPDLLIQGGFEVQGLVGQHELPGGLRLRGWPRLQGCELDLADDEAHRVPAGRGAVSPAPPGRDVSRRTHWLSLGTSQCLQPKDVSCSQLLGHGGHGCRDRYPSFGQSTPSEHGTSRPQVLGPTPTLATPEPSGGLGLGPWGWKGIPCKYLL